MSDRDMVQIIAWYERFISPKSCVLLLNGLAGSGKHAIANALELALKLDGTTPRLIERHHAVGLARAIHPTPTEAHYALRKKVRQTVLEELKELKKERLIIIYTAILTTETKPTPYDDLDQLQEYVDLADAKGVPLIVVNLSCGPDPGRRRERGMTKLTDTEVPGKLPGNISLLNLEHIKSCINVGKVIFFELDTSVLTVGRAVQQLRQALCWENTAG